METCVSCQKPKGAFACGICQGLSCKKCIQSLAEGSFSFLNQIPADLTHRKYCGRCFDEKVAPELHSYQQAMAKAKKIIVFIKGQGEETRLYKRTEKPVQVVDCRDREETLLRLAFFAARANFNGLVDVTISGEKVRNGAYQTSRWHGTGIPTQIDESKLAFVGKKLLPQLPC